VRGAVFLIRFNEAEISPAVAVLTVPVAIEKLPVVLEAATLTWTGRVTPAKFELKATTVPPTGDGCESVTVPLIFVPESTALDESERPDKTGWVKIVTFATFPDKPLASPL